MLDSTRWCVVVAVTVAASSVLAVPADAKRRVQRPDLVELSVSSPSRSEAKPGETFTITDVVKNKGRTAAARSVTSYCLNGKPVVHACAWAVGSRAVPRLKRGKRSQGTATLTVPQQLEQDPGNTWSVVACSDSKGKVKESSEANNCKLAAGTIKVVGGDPPTQQDSPGLQGSGSFTFGPEGAVDFSVSFNQAVTGFEIWVPRDEVVYASMTSRSDGTCSKTAEAGPYNGTKYVVVYCSLSSNADMFAPNEVVTGRIGVSPSASAGMGGVLYAYVADPEDESGGKTTGPFQITGP